MTSDETRRRFLEFYKSKGHTIVPSASLIPESDPTLLFIAAGMAPLKPYFMGQKTDMTRAASCQKSFRTTDIDRVGSTARHLTFFEMLGNFSFGDYFKEESIAWGWEFLTKEMGLSPERLYVTVFSGGMAKRDDEAAAIWKKVLGPGRESRISFLGAESNFWTMGDTGPCGPCSEIYYDFGPELAHEGCPGPGCDCDRYIEIWNHVFTQFDRQADGSLKELPRRNIDTGMGLERLCMVLQGKKSPFETDLFSPITDKACELLKISAQDRAKRVLELRVVADHARACTFLINDGVTPSNEGRGYILRRIIRRALRYGKLLGHKEPFLHLLVPEAAKIFKPAYPELTRNLKDICEAARAEEERFLETLESGEHHIQALLEKNPKCIPGDEAFRLYETYGFPLELTREIARKNGRSVDEAGYEKARAAAQQVAKSGWKGSGQKEAGDFHKLNFNTAFEGYEKLALDAKVSALTDADGKQVSSLAAGAEGCVVLDKTPFYAESGGQTGDTGRLLSSSGELIAEVLDTQKPAGGLIIHIVRAKAELKPGIAVRAEVSRAERTAAMCNHTATHLVNAALRKVLGANVRQAGSMVSPERFRFDYTTAKAPTPEQLAEMEAFANEAVARDYAVFKQERPLKDAEQFGAVTLLGEKYADPARFVLINKGGFDGAKDRVSLELCGGTHADHTGELLTVKILKDSALSAGVRRIEGVAGPAAISYFRELAALAENAARALATTPDKLEQRAAQLLSREKELRHEVDALKQKLASGGAAAAADSVELSGGLKLVASRVDGADAKLLRNAVDALRDKNKNAVVLAASFADGKAAFAVGVTKDASHPKADAGAIAKALAEKHGGKAGGRKDFAQGGASFSGGWPEFLKAATDTTASYLL